MHVGVSGSAGLVKYNLTLISDFRELGFQGTGDIYMCK